MESLGFRYYIWVTWWLGGDGEGGFHGGAVGWGGEGKQWAFAFTLWQIAQCCRGISRVRNRGSRCVAGSATSSWLHYCRCFSAVITPTCLPRGAITQISSVQPFSYSSRLLPHSSHAGRIDPSIPRSRLSGLSYPFLTTSPSPRISGSSNTRLA
jgi:hypothetical protein